MRLLRPNLAILLLSMATLVPAVASAHGGEAGITTFPAEAPAGGPVTAFGEDLEPETPMQLHLLTADGDLLVAEPTTDEAGHFSMTLTLPDTLTERTYELRLTSPSGESISTFVTVAGSGTDAADAPANASSGSTSGLLWAAILGLGGIGLLALALRPTKGERAG
ncbi:MAG: hypothetical protein ACRDE6_01010 [Candidatus Limnocylindria bacterium]